MKRLNLRGLDGSGATDQQTVVWDDAANKWVPATPASGGDVATDAIFDAKGDLPVGTAADTAARLAVGTDGQVLTADSAETTGVKWANAAGGFTDPTTTKGDLLTRTTTGPDRLAVGTDGQVLTADSTQTLGVKWATPGGGGSSWTQVVNDACSSTTGFLAALSGTWAINAGVLRQSNGSGKARMSHATPTSPGSIRAVEVECAYVSGTGTLRRMGLIVSSTNAASDNPIVYLESAAGTSWTARLERDSTLLNFTSATLAYGGTGYVKIGVIANVAGFDIYVDGTWVGFSASAGSTLGTYVGLYTNDVVADFRNLKTWSFLTPPF